MGTKTRKFRRMSRKLRRHTKRKLRESRRRKNKRRSKRRSKRKLRISRKSKNKRSYKFKNCNRPNKIKDCRDMEDPITLDKIPDNANEEDYVQIDSGHCITNDMWQELKSFRSPGQKYVSSPMTRQEIWCEKEEPPASTYQHNEGIATYRTPMRELGMELDYLAFALEQKDYRNYSTILEEYSRKLYVPNSLRTQLLELSLELEDVDPYFTRMTRTVMRKLERAEQLLRIVYGNGVSYYEQQFGIPYIPN